MREFRLGQGTCAPCDNLVQLSCILCSCARHLLSTDILNVTISGKRQACTLSTSLSYIAMNLACVASCLFAYSPASNDQTSVRYQRTSKTFSCALASRDRSCLSQRQILPFTETDPAFHRDRSCLSQRAAWQIRCTIPAGSSLMQAVSVVSSLCITSDARPACISAI